MKENTEESKIKHTFTSTLYNLYKNWMKQNYSNENVLNNRSFCNSLKKLYPNHTIGQLHINGNHGWVLKILF